MDDKKQLQHLDRPTRYSYEVDENLWGGEYPIDKDPQKSVVKLDEIIRFGITDFVDLTEDGELFPYQGMLPPSVTHNRFPIRDGGIPKTYKQMDQIQQRIESALSNPFRKVYIHCWGGVGRTGTTIACYFIRRGYNPEQALEALRKSFAMNEKSAWRIIPENPFQVKFVYGYYQWLKGSGKQ